MHKFSQKLSLIIVGTARINDTTEMVSYSLEAILTSTLTALTAFLISLYLNCTYEFFIFNICFIPIRMKHKSFHFKKFIQCFICSNFMIVLCSLILRQSHYYYIYTLVFFILSTLFYYLSLEKNIYELLIIVIFFTLSLFFNKTISLAILLSILMNTILILGRLYNEKNIKHD